VIEYPPIQLSTDDLDQRARKERWNNLVVFMAKAKTQAWIDKVLERYGATQGQIIVNG
jgi:hypothetical protein